LLRDIVKTKLDLEMAATSEIIKIAVETLPELATLVPEKRQELTTEGGLDVRGNRHRLREVVNELHRSEIRVSLFVDPVRDQIEAAREVEADTVELHTGEYANAREEHRQRALLEEIRDSARFAKELGLTVNAGHGLNYQNVIPFRTIEEIDEISIGHAVIARAVMVGLENAVKEMLRLVQGR
jgi:pyridoxine 5-phosphate synthase